MVKLTAGMGIGQSDKKADKRYIDLTATQQRQIDDYFLDDPRRRERLFRDMERGKLGPEWRVQLETFRSKTAAKWPSLK